MTASQYTNSTERYRGMDRDELDRAYDNEAAFPDVRLWRERWRIRGDLFSIPNGALLDLPYGPSDRQKIDIFPCDDANAATALFFHGGFWSRNSKETFRFLAAGVRELGLNAAFAGYRLSSDCAFEDIIADAGNAIAWLQSNLKSIGLAERPMILIGWSAGAHLISMHMGLPGIAGGLAISGIYDLEPMRIFSLNDKLRLNKHSARRCSPLHELPPSSPPLIIAFGDDELPEFRRQSIEFHERWTKGGLTGDLLALSGRHHHSVLEELHDPDGRLRAPLICMAGG